jgi:hypothetical protein
MASKFLPAIIGNAIEENQDLLPALIRGKADLRRIFTFCSNFRIAGISSLFLSGKSEDFRYYFHKSGRAFAHFLRNAQTIKVRLSKSQPFFDAVGAGDYEGAAQIAHDSCRTWAQGEEYEEDFLFFDFLMQLFFLGASSAACGALLERYEKCLQGAEDRRLDICKSLLHKDSDAFNSALRNFLLERKEALEKMAETQTIGEEQLATEWHFSVEGLALVRLAERRGIHTEEEYLHIPSIAREDAPLRFHADSWKNIEE